MVSSHRTPHRDEPTGGLIFVSDASAEAARLSVALRARGYVLAEVPLGVLQSRVAVQRPALILCDADAEGALETIRSLRAIPGGVGIEIVFLGDKHGAIAKNADAFSHEATGLFKRPVEVYALLRKVEALIGPPGEPDSALAPSSNRSPVLVASSRKPYRFDSSGTSLAPDSKPGAKRPASDPPASPQEELAATASTRSAGGRAPVVVGAAPKLPGISLAPEGKPPALLEQIPHAEISAELSRMLSDAERSLGKQQASMRPRLSPEAEVEAVLPADLLDALEEPLEDDDDVFGDGDEGTSSGSQTGLARERELETSPGTSDDRATGAERRRPGSEGPLAGQPRPASELPPGSTGERTALRPALEPGGSEFPPPEAGVDEAAPARVAMPPPANAEPPRAADANDGEAPPTPRELPLPGGAPSPPAVPRFVARAAGVGAAAPRISEVAGPDEGEPKTAAGRAATERPPAAGSQPGERPAAAEHAQPSTLPPRPRPSADSPRETSPSHSTLDALTAAEPHVLDARRTAEEARRAAGSGAAPAASGPSSMAPISMAPRAAGLGDRESIRGNAGPSTEPIPEETRGTAAASQPGGAPPVPSVITPGATLTALARAISERATGALAIEAADAIHRILLRDGDIVIAASGGEQETLLAFLTERGDIAPETAAGLARRVPPFGRHAGAALVAHGHVRQDELWSVLRDHAEWLLGRLLLLESGSAGWEDTVPERLSSEPAVFGGAAGAEVFVEAVRRAIRPDVALGRIGGRDANMEAGRHPQLLDECALGDAEEAAVRRGLGGSVGDLLAAVGSEDFASVLYALRELGVWHSERSTIAPARRAAAGALEAASAKIDDLALRERIVQRRALVTESDYFTLLGVSRRATGYDIEQAYDRLKQQFARERVLTPVTLDLSDDVELIHEVLDEAFEILSDQVRRERYRRALEAPFR